VRIRAIIFDLDGTLLDTLEDIASSMNRVLETMGFVPHPIEDYKLLVGDGIANLVKRALPESFAGNDEIVRRALGLMKREYSKSWRLHTRPYEGVPELLDELQSRGIPMAILSNKNHEFTVEMVSALLSKWRFYPVLGQRPGLPLKPDPQGALEISRTLGIAPGDFLYLGDTGTDMRTASSAGMYPVGALWGFRSEEELKKGGARRLISHPTELVRLLESEGWF
jgi:phosphoglycolate phosphatase